MGVCDKDGVGYSTSDRACPYVRAAGWLAALALCPLRCDHSVECVLPRSHRDALHRERETCRLAPSDHGHTRTHSLPLCAAHSACCGHTHSRPSVKTASTSIRGTVLPWDKDGVGDSTSDRACPYVRAAGWLAALAPRPLRCDHSVESVLARSHRDALHRERPGHIGHIFFHDVAKLTP